MHVGLLLVDCFIPQSCSLKDKRRALAGTVERLKRRFNISACEVEYQDQWQRARLAIVMVNTNARMLDSGFSKVLEFLERNRQLEVIDTTTERLL